MRKIFFTLLLIGYICSYCSQDLENNVPIIARQNSLGCKSSSFSNKSFLAYFYTTDDIRLKVNNLDQPYIFQLKGNNDFYLTTTLPAVFEHLNFVGEKPQPKELPFYLLELYQKNTLAVVLVNYRSSTAHLPTELPLEFRVLASPNKYFEFFFTLRADNLARIKSVKLQKVRGDEIVSSLSLNADNSKVYRTESIKYEDFDAIYLQIKLINESTDKNVKLQDFLQADYHLTSEPEKESEIDNKPEYVIPGQIFYKTTTVSSFDDFIIEYPGDSLEVIEVNLNNFQTDTAKHVVINKDNIHVSLNQEVQLDPYYFNASYSLQIKFLVKEILKISQPILIARYDIENLKNTEGFVLAGNFFDNKVFFKTTADILIGNNVYFAFQNPQDGCSVSHQISIGYDQIPSSDYSDWSSFNRIHHIQLEELKVDLERAAHSKEIIIGLKRACKYSSSSLSSFEVIITQDKYQQINEKSDIDIPYNLRRGQSFNLINFGVKIFDRSFLRNRDSHYYSIENEIGNTIKNGAIKSKNYYGLKSLFTFNNSDQFTGKKFFEFSREFQEPYEGLEASLLKITATSAQAIGTIKIRQDSSEFTLQKEENEKLAFLN